jgi:FkbM family methyltransferase
MSDSGKHPTATLDFRWGEEERHFECFDNCLSRVTCQTILDGKSYPRFPFVEDVSVVMDVGANVGAASVFFSLAYPEATVFSFEPGELPYSLLVRNTEELDNVRINNFGLYSSDAELPLYRGKYETGMSSVNKSMSTRSESDMITLRSARDWLAENSITAVDVLKVDTEGCEIPILGAMRDFLPTVKVIYLEYHNDDDRKELDRILGETHLLVHGMMMAHLGEVAYVAKDVVRSGSDLDSRAIRLDL